MSKLAANLVVVAPSHEFSSAVAHELSAQLHAPLITSAAPVPAPDASGQVILVTADALGDPEASRELAASGPAYSLVIPVDQATAPPPWCTPINTAGRTPEAVAAEIMNDAANKHAVELDPIRSSRTGLSSTAAYVIIALAAALLLFGCAALVIGFPISNRAEERVIFEDRGAAFEEAPAIEIVRGPPIPPPVDAPPADEYQPLTVLNETGPEVENRIRSQFGSTNPESAVLLGVAITSDTEREIYTWAEMSPDGEELSCVGIANFSGGSSSCSPPNLGDPSISWSESSTDNGLLEFDVSTFELPDETRWIVFVTDSGWRIVTDNTDGFATALWPEMYGPPVAVTAYDGDLDELWNGSF